MFIRLFDLLSVFILHYLNFVCNNLRGSQHDDGLHTHIFREDIAQLSTRIDLVKQTRAANDTIHEVVFILPQKSLIELTIILHEISDPDSLIYGQHMTRENVVSQTMNQESHDVVVQYLKSQDVAITSNTISGEYVTAAATIAVWEKMFNTEFYTFQQMDDSEHITEIVRTERYWIPREIDLHVESVLRTIDIPIIGLSDGFDGWILRIANALETPSIINIDYGLDEKYVPDSYHKAFTATAIKLGCMGVTILVASGEDGANRYQSKDEGRRKRLSCGYSPTWPATNPYVTAVGATSVVSVVTLYVYHILLSNFALFSAVLGCVLSKLMVAWLVMACVI